MLSKDDFYKDILKGLAVYFDSDFISDIQKTTVAFPRPELANALNKNQTRSKKWLIDALHQAMGGRLGVVHILGGWYGVLGAMLLHDRRFDIDQVVSIDNDPTCEAVANSLNGTLYSDGRFTSITADIYELDYNAAALAMDGISNPVPRAVVMPDIIISTSCEHLSRFGDWYENLPAGMPLVLQSNDFFDCDEHVNCVPDLEAFKRQAPMAEILFEGGLALKKYTRFMLIGRK
jgi:hypothetical protein